MQVAYFIAALSPNIDVANAALPCYITTLIFFSGLLILWSEIPDWWSWYRYINFLGYAWGALMVNEYGGDRDIEFLYDPETNTTQTVLEYFSLDGVDKWAFLGYESLFFVGFFGLAFLALRFVNFTNR